MMLEDGYVVSCVWMCCKIVGGCKVIGYKIGLISCVMQCLFNVDEFDFGMLFDDMLFFDGNDILIVCFIELCVEVELVFIFKYLFQGLLCMFYDVFNVIDYVIFVIEIIDVWIEWIDKVIGVICKVFDMISDNVVNVGLVLGGWLVKFDVVDLCWVLVLFYCNGVIEELGVVVVVFNYLVNGFVWFVNKLVLYGEMLEFGQIVLGGSFIVLVFVWLGDSFYVDYGLFGVILVCFV